MSMLSAQCDELRKVAEQLDWELPETAMLLRDAADTIWELRDDLQRANAAVQDAEHDESMAWDRVRKAEAENAKLRSENARLRSICTEVADILFSLEADRCGLCDRDSVNHPCPVHTVKGGECLIKSELRELGVDG